MKPDLAQAAAALLGSPWTWVLATLLAYRLAVGLHRRSGFKAWSHPVAVATLILAAVLGALGVDYQTYFDGARLIHWLLGPATVALAVPLYRQLARLRRDWLAFGLGALLGSATAVVSAIVLASLLGASRETVLSMSAKSVTMPIALGITDKLGGTPSLTSAFVMLTGILGAALAPALLKRVGLSAPDTTGFSLGVVSHGIGTSRALQESQEMGAFASLAMGLAGMFTGLLVPVLWSALPVK